MPEITMPQLSDTMTEGTVVKWHKKEGDKVREGEKLADVETDKAVMEMEAFDSGTLTEIRVKDGQKAPVGAVLAVLSGAAEKKEESSKAAPAPAPAAEPSGSAAGSKPPPKPQPAAPAKTPAGIGAAGASVRDTELGYA